MAQREIEITTEPVATVDGLVMVEGNRVAPHVNFYQMRPSAHPDYDFEIYWPHSYLLSNDEKEEAVRQMSERTNVKDVRIVV